jgi:diguanylate cyclase (GGDEF)-like protein/PAS domain S-box-containing protein
MPDDKDTIAALRAENLNLRAVLNNVGSYIYTKYIEGRYTFANQSVCALFGQPLEAIVGKRDSAFFDRQTAENLHRIDQSIMQSGETSAHEETTVLRVGPDADTSTYWAVKAPIRDANGAVTGMCGISTDITERKRLEQDLHREREQQDLILNNVGAHVFIKTCERRFLYVNDLTATLFGLPGEQIVGRLDSEVVSPEDADSMWVLDRQVFDSGCKQSGEETLTDRSGNTRHYWSIKVPVQLPGQPPALIGFAADVTELHQLKETLKHQAMHDALTGVPNRRAFFDQAERLLSAAHRHSQPLSVIMLDIDHFKRINDSYGHYVGDNVLAAVAKHCVSLLRAGDMLGRIGGEEFAILLPQTGLEAAHTLALRICRSLHELSIAIGDANTVSLTASLGVAMLRQEDQTFSNLLERADYALYAAKEGGRDRITCA